jgi:hypothetical protein
MIINYHKSHSSGHRKGYALRITGIVDGARGVNGFVAPGDSVDYLREGENNLPEGALVLEIRPCGTVKHPSEMAVLARVTASDAPNMGLLADTTPEREYDWREDYYSLQSRAAELLAPAAEPEAEKAPAAEAEPLADIDTDVLIRALQARGYVISARESGN